MGTDIRMYAEWRSHEQWQFIGRMVKNEFYEDDPKHEMPYYPESLYHTRKYSLFAILADVENGLLEEKYECIAPLRGLPDDLSPELKTWSESFRNREVIASWLTLEELVTFDWHGKSRKKYAVVDKRVAYLFHPEHGFPFREWPQGRIPIGYTPAFKEYANASWTETYADAAGPEFLELLDAMANTYGISNNVRFIFWFRQ